MWRQAWGTLTLTLSQGEREHDNKSTAARGPGSLVDVNGEHTSPASRLSLLGQSATVSAPWCVVRTSEVEANWRTEDAALWKPLKRRKAPRREWKLLA